MGHALQQQARVLTSFFLPFFFLSLFTSLFLSFFYVSSILSFRKLRSHDISTSAITNLIVQWYRNTVLIHCGRVTQICVFNTVKLGSP